MDPLLLPKIKLFFQELRKANYNPKFLDYLPHTIKDESLSLLRSLPEFQGDEFKNDANLINNLSNHLRDPIRARPFLKDLGIFTQQEQTEFAQIFEKPIEEIAPEQTTGQVTTAGEQAAPAASEQQPGMDAGAQPHAAGTPGAPSLGGGATHTPAARPKIVYVTKTPAAEGATKETVPGLKSTPETGLDYEGKGEYGPEDYRAGRQAWAGESAAKAEAVKKEAQAAEQAVKAEGVRLQRPRIPKAVSSAGKSLASDFQIGTKKGLTRVGKGLGQMAKGLGRGVLGPGLTGTYNIGGRALSRGLTFGSRLSEEVSSGKLRLKKPSKRFLLLLLGMLFLLIVTSGFARPTQTGPGGPGGTGGGNIGELSCTTSMTADSINKYFDDKGYSEFAGSGNTIMAAAQKDNINPAIIIAIGRQESVLGKAYRGQPEHDKNNAFGIKGPNGEILRQFSSWGEGATMAFDIVKGYNCTDLACVGKTYSEDPNWPAKVANIYANEIPHSSCVTGLDGVPSGWPANGSLNGYFPFQVGTTHENANAIDVSGSYGTPVYATLDGKVALPEDDPGGYGHYVLITNDKTGFKAIYAHFASFTVGIGETVKKGQQIGLMDSTGLSTGNHVHYQLFVPGGYPIDFNNYIPDKSRPMTPGENVQAGGF